MILRTLPARTSGLLIAILVAQTMNIQPKRNVDVFGLFSRIRTLCAGLCSATVLGSCVQGTQIAHSNNPPTGEAPYPEVVRAAVPNRFIITFNRSVPFDSSSFLFEMQSRTQARFSYLSSISSATHVYEIQPLFGQPLSQVLRTLTGLPVVQGVEIDQKIKNHQ